MTDPRTLVRRVAPPDMCGPMGLDPNSPEVLAVRGLVLFLSGKLPRALGRVASALRLDPEH